MKLPVILYVLAVYGVLIVALCTGNFSCTHNPNNPEFYFKGKSYVVVGLQGAGYTHEHKSPVYTLVVISKEDSKKWIKK